MKRLITSLQRFSADSAEHVELFSKLTLRDLGFYVSDKEAMRYMSNTAYPIAKHAFQLENALHQFRFSSGAAAVTPMPWKSSPDEILGCSTLYQDEAVTLCWFVIPPGRALPLHDHPGMSVWQRVMHGRLHVCSIDRHEEGAGIVTFAGEVDGVGGTIAPADVLSFAPHAASGKRDGGVLHEIRNVDAAQPALFVDIISPPYYQAPSNVACGYFTAVPVDPAAVAAPALPEECGVRHAVKAGDRVDLYPREGYAGPDMHAFIHIE